MLLSVEAFKFQSRISDKKTRSEFWMTKTKSDDMAANVVLWTKFKGDDAWFLLFYIAWFIFEFKHFYKMTIFCKVNLYWLFIVNTSFYFCSLAFHWGNRKSVSLQQSVSNFLSKINTLRKGLLIVATFLKPWLHSFPTNIQHDLTLLTVHFRFYLKIATPRF